MCLVCSLLLALSITLAASMALHQPSATEGMVNAVAGPPDVSELGAVDCDGSSRSNGRFLADCSVSDGRKPVEHLHLAQLESPDSGPAEKLWEDDFSGNWVNRWGTVYVNQNERYSTFRYGGESWLRVTYPEGQERVGFHLKSKIESQDHVYLEYRLRISENFDWVKGGKLPGLYGGLVKAGHVPNGKDGFIVRFMWRRGGAGSAYVYHPDQPRKFGEHFRLENFWFHKGVVQTLGLEVVMNTPGVHDGIIRAWLDGVLVVEETDIRFRDNPALQIDGIKFDTFFGGNNDTWAPTKNETIDFGDFKIYSSPVRKDFGLSTSNP